MKRLLFSVMCLALVAFMATPSPSQEMFPNAPEVLNPEGRDKLKPTTFNFLKVSTNARVSGMGEAFTAVADGMDGIIWNSAGLASVEGFGYALNYTSWLVDSQFFSGALAYNTGYGVLGVSLVSFSLPASPETTTMKPDGTGRSVSTGDMAIGVAYAKQLTDKLSAGATVRYVQSKLGEDTLSGVSINVNTLMYTGFRSLRVGMNMKNLGGEQEIVSQKSEMPLVFNLGSAMEVIGDLGEPVSLTAAFEGAYFTDRNQRWNLGGELWLRNIFAVRAGYKFKYDEETWSIGGGLRANFDGRKIQVDASYTNFGNLFDAPLRLSLSGAF